MVDPRTGDLLSLGKAQDCPDLGEYESLGFRSLLYEWRIRLNSIVCGWGGRVYMCSVVVRV